VQLAIVLCCGWPWSAASAAFVSPDSADAVRTASPVPGQRPKVALVLSGGGARGFAHIGVLRALQELRVPVDIVVGTSMGSVVGGAYAAGASVDQLEQLLRRTDWNAVVGDRSPRDELVYRRREEDLLLPSRIELGARLDGVSLPPAAAGNAALELALTRVLPPGARDKPANLLQLPFRSVASDLVTGELVELSDTPLFLAMRASLAVPGVFAPVRVNQRLLVDGGLVRNLPVDVAREMGADIIIAVNVGTPLAPEKELGSAVSVAQQMLQILTEQNVQRSLRELHRNDILLQPELDGIGFFDFARHARAVKAGEAAVRAIAGRLAALTVPAPQYAAYELLRLSPPPPADLPLRLARLDVVASGHINSTALAVQSGLKTGQLVTRDEALRGGNLLLGRGDLAQVRTEVRDDENGRNVLIKPTEADWTLSRLRLGLELTSDFSENNAFQLKAMHVLPSLNDWGAELRSIVSVGTVRTLGAQFWQPLGAGSPWYLAPSLEEGAGSDDIFSAKGTRVARRTYVYDTVSLAWGRQLGRSGDLRYTLGRRIGSSRQAIPASVAGERDYQTVGALSLNFDTLDTVAFPTRGLLFSLEWQHALNRFAAPAPAPTHQEAGILQAFHYQRWAGHVYADWARSQGGAADNSLGGFLRLSGSTPHSLVGASTVLGRVVAARSIGAMPATLGGDIRLGFSVESGGAYGDADPLRWGTLKRAHSGFIAVDTRFGALYFGVGATKGADRSAYLFLGPIW
jgi:NTE family protein